MGALSGRAPRSRFVHAFTSAYSVTCSVSTVLDMPVNGVPILHARSARSLMSQQRTGSTSGSNGSSPNGRTAVVGVSLNGGADVDLKAGGSEPFFPDLP